MLVMWCAWMDGTDKTILPGSCLNTHAYRFIAMKRCSYVVAEVLCLMNMKPSTTVQIQQTMGITAKRETDGNLKSWTGRDRWRLGRKLDQRIQFDWKLDIVEAVAYFISHSSSLGLCLNTSQLEQLP